MINIYNIFVRMKILGYFVLIFSLLSNSVFAQAPATYSSSDILHRIQKLKVLGSALYIAAHPDDENTRLLGWLSNDQHLRTGYLSLTRGDGGQNLIGDEQGIELGLIRTQELLAARRVDGAEQFFTRAFDFGYSKSTEEALRFWGKEQILSDMVWVIRKFQPDVIVTRFPPDSRAGHGQHSASAVLAHEAFRLAADPKAFTSQFQYGVKPWMVTRLLWNSYVFGSINTTSEDHLKIDIGGYNPLLGKSYGEIAALSRSQHKSQGFGVPSGRGSQLEYFSHIDGRKTSTNLTEGINLSWNRIGASGITSRIDAILKTYSATQPSKSVPALVALYQEINKLPGNYWKVQKLSELKEIIAAANGIWLEAYTTKAFAVQGDSLEINYSINNREGVSVSVQRINNEVYDTTIKSIAKKNANLNFSNKFIVSKNKPVSQPYWLKEKMSKGFFSVQDQELVGNPESEASFTADFNLMINGYPFTYKRPVQFKHTDPVKGELYQPLLVVPPVKEQDAAGLLRQINYDHIPSVSYFNTDSVNIALDGLQIAGKKIGYIPGAGDKVPAALSRMGYEITELRESDLQPNILKQYDAIITGVRAYNVHKYLSDKNEVLNNYIKNGGNLVVQYTTNNYAGPNNAIIGPYRLRISRERITDETAPVKFLLPNHPVLNYPNKIEKADFDNWVQERGLYFPEFEDSVFVAPLAMNDPGEKDLKGSLIIADYGKGKFVYTGLSFFRQLPAGVTGAYRLLANIIALNKTGK